MVSFEAYLETEQKNMKIKIIKEKGSSSNRRQEKRRDVRD